MVMRYVWGAPWHPAANPLVPAVYVGTMASAKLDKSAVRRNRMRRRCREALRTELQKYDTFPAHQLLIAPRSGSLTAPFADIQTDIRNFLTFLHGSSTKKK
ncbi:MAG: hypothetical protein JWM56_421 [Candidatus Peribacteria bacterium]|nr:hypothetical protein [Candidatus Peribacteria bacterium]